MSNFLDSLNRRTWLEEGFHFFHGILDSLPLLTRKVLLIFDYTMSSNIGQNDFGYDVGGMSRGCVKYSTLSSPRASLLEIFYERRINLGLSRFLRVANRSALTVLNKL